MYFIYYSNLATIPFEIVHFGIIYSSLSSLSMSHLVSTVRGDKLCSNTMHVQVFSEDLLADFITHSSCLRELIDYSVIVLMAEFTNIFFLDFLAFCW